MIFMAIHSSESLRLLQIESRLNDSFKITDVISISFYKPVKELSSAHPSENGHVAAT